DRILAAPEHVSGRIVAAVADGLGGMKNGEKAAEIAVEILGEAAGDLLSTLGIGFIDASAHAAEVYQRINDGIGSWAERHDRAGAVATTLVTLILSGSRYLVVNAGD